MSLTFEKQEGNMAKLTIERTAQELDQAITKAYQKIRNQVSLPGFRKGKVPQFMIEKQYGVEVFYEDAANFLINDSYKEEIKDCELEIVSQPDIEVTQIEKGKPFIYEALVAVKPEVTLGEYKGLEYYKTETAVSEDEINSELERTREMNSRRVPVEDRPAQNGDIVNIDFEGFVDGNAFEGGKAEGHTLTLGSGTFIPGFEEQIEGKNLGEEFDVNVTFPEDYQAENLKGKAAVFKCKLNDIKVKELPELDDEFASEVSEFDTLEEYKADIRKNMEEARAEEAKRAAKNQLVDEAVEKAEMIIPGPMVDLEASQVAQNFQMRMESQGINMDQYFQFTGMTPEKFMEDAKTSAEKNIKSRLVLEAVAAAENIEVSDEDLENEIRKMAESYQMEYDQLNKIISDDERENMKLDVLISKAADFLYDNGVAVDKPVEEEKEEAAQEAPAEE
ncbi:MAG: trigger factor [Parasporobacterium sp.]|nr:trigger factor [Parasporobacterium sp.]